MSVLSLNIPQIGIYYYPWYNASRWMQHPRLHTPVVGEYDSANDVLIGHHVTQLQDLGVDYIVIEMLPLNDWAFQDTLQATQKFIQALRITDLQYTFLIDTAVGTGHKDSCAYFGNLLTLLHEYCLMPTKMKNGKPLLFFFSTTVPETVELTERYGCDYSIVLPIFLPSWSFADDVTNTFLRTKGYAFPPGTPRSVSLTHTGFIPFWTNTCDIFASNSFAAVIPGYDDRLLKRSSQFAPYVPRQDGQTLVEQFSRAVATGAKEILIYGWNEYFEATEIEPTLEHGDFYFELTRRLIAQVKNNTPIHMPEDMGKPQAGKIIYLSPELERSTQHHVDRIPRWDQDDYLAEIRFAGELEITGNHLVLKEIQVKNAGNKNWPIISQNIPIRLGVQLFDDSNHVVREGRAEFGRDMTVGTELTLDCAIELTGLFNGNYNIRLGVVWENKYWFQSYKQKHIEILFHL